MSFLVRIDQKERSTDRISIPKLSSEIPCTSLPAKLCDLRPILEVTFQEAKLGSLISVASW